MDNRQTEMALVPPRVEDQERDQRDRMNNLTLESVPGFQRPMSSGPNDQIVGQDELGRNVYETPTGQRYTISLNPDQRTLRTRVEEDVIPAIGEYLQNPTMPTAEQVVGFAKDVAVGAYEPFYNVVRGQGTVGDVFETASGTAALSAFNRVPEGALRIFGGFERAADPGRQADRTPLPRSVGADGKERFEIDDSGAEYIPDNLKTLNVRSDWDNIDFDAIENGFREAPWARLDEVIDHPELFRQYPDLAELRIVTDPSLGASTYGEFWADKNLISVSSAILNMPDVFARTLLHEIQHGVARREGFDAGTNRFSSEVDRRIEPGVRQYQDDMRVIRENFNNFDFQTRIETMKNFLQDIAAEVEADGVLDLDEVLFESKSGRDLSLETLLDEMSDNTFEFNDVSYSQLQNFYSLFRDNPQLLDEASTERFQSLFNVNPADLEQLSAEKFLDYLEDAGSIPFAPERFGQIIPQLRTRAYRTRSGEVEARNVEDRMNLSLEERRQQAPITTEDVARESQWVVDDQGNIINAVTQEPRTDGMLARAINFVLGRRGMAEGGAVTMDRQMDLFEEGGLMDDGAEKDPVSGNDVPAGSMSEEVRDDVPVMLSEGEYVVPADVVRYYGLNFFENLRDKAKDGLQDMEASGRIGGEPMDATPGDEDITPEERRMLMEVMGMAQGGMVQGYQVGGMTTQPYQSPYMPQPQYTAPGLSVFGTPLPTTTPVAPVGGAQTPVTLYSPQGVAFNMQLPRDQQRYNNLISQGYTTQMPGQVSVGIPTQPTAPQQDGGDDYREISETEMERSIAQATTGQNSFTVDELNRIQVDPIGYANSLLDEETLSPRAGSMIGSVVGGPVMGILGGAALSAAQVSNLSKARAAATYARQQGRTADADAIEQRIADGLENAPLSVRIMDSIFPSSGARRLADIPVGLERLARDNRPVTSGILRGDVTVGELQNASMDYIRNLSGSGREYAESQLRSGYTGTTVGGIAVGNISDGTSAGVVVGSRNADGAPIALKDDQERTVYRDNNGNTYVKSGLFGQRIEYVSIDTSQEQPQVSPAAAPAAPARTGSDSGSDGRFDSGSGGYSGPAAGDTSNIGSWGGDRDGDGVKNWRDFNDGVGANDKNTDGSGSSEGSGKIVCTAMNNSYGFGSYRQAIWLKYSADNLTEYHEKGYHKIFLPLVDRAYNRGESNSMFIRKVLENIARHRTADLRAEMQGKKRDKVGRAYRAVLEPICYIVGRLSK